MNKYSQNEKFRWLLIAIAILLTLAICFKYEKQLDSQYGIDNHSEIIDTTGNN